ncbi:efflux RND transporter periplasmic adaptor subunit [Oscillatoria salina]|uniref:efflux RND transporter periplasmic adaptor subunit n=1 Tax=Oscillatoria salina TaxID=331517 RepID=UPI0013BCB325|nr:efflux RND transporter periplasmic adaptor subunit [Oscillatoria salina]MBZ8178810.1 efflux RND transporter periplasmic adaptor subunit [Oscillatoria salina IIICB1]NET88195.1 efflux RND transporter periplasmic adaptor subunit [Kamptonema sp. SIO1D9]
MIKSKIVPLVWILAALLLPSLASCNLLEKDEADAQSGAQEQGNSITAVDVAIASPGVVEEAIEYVGTTKPSREVSLRSQVEGRLLSLSVDVGSRVSQAQVIARLDDSLLVANVNEAKAELAALESEIAQTKARVSNSRTQLERAKAELQEAVNNAQRYTNLAQQGAVTQQQAESFQTAAKVAEQAVLSAQEQIRSEEEAVAAAIGRVAAQKAVLAQEEQRQAYSQLNSPITGVVTEKVSEPGDLITAGGEVLKLGDFRSVKVEVPVSELDLANIEIGQLVTVKLDSIANETFTGTVTQIAPVAGDARQVPIEVTIPNPDGRIGGGLLARVNFQPQSNQNVVIPETALQEGKIFVVANAQENQQATVAAREVALGNRANGKVEIVSGLKDGERFVVKSGQPLKDGETVRLSILSK